MQPPLPPKRPRHLELLSIGHHRISGATNFANGSAVNNREPCPCIVTFPSASSASIELGKLPSTVAAVAAKKGVVGSKPKVNIFVALF